MNGKGDRNRPKTVSLQEWDRKYQEIFGKDRDETFSNQQKKKQKRRCKKPKE